MSTSSTGGEAEWRLLLAACSVTSSQEKIQHIQALISEPMGWTSLLQLADQHGVTSILYHALSQVNGAPSDLIRLLNERYQMNLHKTLLMARELIRVLDCLEQLNLEAIPYKGASLAETIYGDIAMRQSGDIDLFVRTKDLRRIKDAIRELGYTPHDSLSEAEESAYLISGYECAFDSAAGRNLLEVQWAPQPRFYAVDFDMNSLFQRAIIATVGGREMKTLSPEDLFIILSVHAAKHVWARLIWLCDIAQIMKLPNLNWVWIEERARALGIGRMLRVTMLLANRLLDAAIPGLFESGCLEDRVGQKLVESIRLQIKSGDSYDFESLAYFRIMMRLREQRADRLRFLQRLIFTPGPGEWKAIRLPGPLFPLYRLVRLYRLAVRMVRLSER